MSKVIQGARASGPGAVLPAPSLDRRSVRAIDPLIDRAMAAARVGAWSCDLSDDSLCWTSGVYDIFGFPRETALDRRQTIEMYAEESRETLEKLRGHAIACGGTFTLDAQISRPDGGTRWIRITAETIRHAGRAAILHGLKQDVTEDRLRTEAMRRLAENDALTGLASRAVWEGRFLNRHGRPSSATPLGALVLFDLDGFKAVNDRLGHLAGDACLRVFAERLTIAFPEAALAARIGGDEFALILGDDQPVSAIEARVAAFLARLRAPIVWREHIFTIGATSGIAVPADPERYDPEEVFLRADAALYAAKRSRLPARRSGGR